MVLHAHKPVDRVSIVLDWLQFAGVDIWEIGPTVLAVVGLVIDHEVIPESWSVIFVHTDCESRLAGSEFLAPKLFRRRKQKTLLFVVLLVYPIFWGLPRIRAESDHNVIELSFGYHHSIGHAIAPFVELLSREVVSGGSI